MNTQVATHPEGYLPSVQASQPCFQKFEIRSDDSGRRHRLFQLSWFPSGQSFDTPYSSHFTLEEAQSERTKQECYRDGKPFPPGRYVMTRFDGRNCDGLAESSATIWAKKNKDLYASSGYVPEVVPDIVHPGKFAVQWVLVVSAGVPA